MKGGRCHEICWKMKRFMIVVWSFIKCVIGLRYDKIMGYTDTSIALLQKCGTDKRSFDNI